MGFKNRAAMSVLLISLVAVAQASNPGVSGDAQAANSNVQSARTPTSVNLTPEQRFVRDTVQMAVALPATDPQDRLRVLSTASDVISTVDRGMAKRLWREGVRIESELIGRGQKPVVSMMSSGQADCAAAEAFVENLPPEAALQAEQALIGAVTSCPKQTLDTVSRKLDAALAKNIVAPRALMAAMEAMGTKSPWSQSRFDTMFKSLPDPQTNPGEAANLAAVYSRMAAEVDKERAGQAGVQLLAWLGRLQDAPQRSPAINVTAAAMQQVLGAEGYKQALESDASANSAVQNGAKYQTIERASNAPTSVLDALRSSTSDQSDRLRGLPPSERARQAAAHGFAAGTAGDKAQANKYFDLAFAAADQVWESRAPDTNAAAVVQEVGEAAAQTDSLNALERAQKLRDPSSQAIAMLAVARVVASNGLAAQGARSRR